MLDALRDLPEVVLELIALMPELVDDDGKLDTAKIAYHYDRIQEAQEEAGKYASHTQEAVRCLQALARDR